MKETSEELERVVQRVCALDLGKAGLVACVRVPHPTRPERRLQEVREYTTVTRQLLELADWLRVQQVELVAEGVDLRLLEAGVLPAKENEPPGESDEGQIKEP